MDNTGRWLWSRFSHTCTETKDTVKYKNKEIEHEGMKILVCVCVCIILLMYVYWTAFHVAQTLRICLTQIESQIPSKKISYYDSMGGEGT